MPITIAVDEDTHPCRICYARELSAHDGQRDTTWGAFDVWLESQRETKLEERQAGSWTPARHDDTDDQSREGSTPDDAADDQTAEASLWGRARGFVSTDDR
jgi:hypothetical protein